MRSWRALIGTWVIEEVKLAGRKNWGYWDFLDVRIGCHLVRSAEGQGGFYVECVVTFLKLKTEASGYPDWVRTPKDEDRYTANFLASEGIHLDQEVLRPNAAKRGLVKLCLYYMWGKLTEGNNRMKSKMISCPGYYEYRSREPDVRQRLRNLDIMAFHGGGWDPVLTSYARIHGRIHNSRRSTALVFLSRQIARGPYIATQTAPCSYSLETNRCWRRSGIISGPWLRNSDPQNLLRNLLAEGQKQCLQDSSYCGRRAKDGL